MLVSEFNVNDYWPGSHADWRPVTWDVSIHTQVKKCKSLLLHFFTILSSGRGGGVSTELILRYPGS